MKKNSKFVVTMSLFLLGGSFTAHAQGLSLDKCTAYNEIVSKQDATYDSEAFKVTLSPQGRLFVIQRGQIGLVYVCKGVPFDFIHFSKRLVPVTAFSYRFELIAEIVSSHDSLRDAAELIAENSSKSKNAISGFEPEYIPARAHHYTFANSAKKVSKSDTAERKFSALRLSIPLDAPGREGTTPKRIGKAFDYLFKEVFDLGSHDLDHLKATFLVKSD